VSYISELTYKRTKNLGNYESVVIEARVTLDAKDDFESEFKDLERWVLVKLDEAADATIATPKVS